MTTSPHTPDLDEAGLAPCPHCAGAAKSYDRPDPSGWGNAFWVSCTECGAETGMRETMDLAIAAWNLRATTAGEPVASPSDDLIAFCITETLGERCDDFDADCYTCQAWAQYDAHPSPDSDLLREALAGIDWRSIVQLQIARMKDAGESHEMLARWITTEIRTRLDAALSAAPAGGKVERLRDRLDKQMDYACDLQRIIEDLCHRREIREPQTAARHHYDMAVAYRAALNEGGSDDPR